MRIRAIVIAAVIATVVKTVACGTIEIIEMMDEMRKIELISIFRSDTVAAK